MRPMCIEPGPRRSLIRVAFLVAVSLASPTPTLPAASTTDALEATFAFEARLLDLLGDQYASARRAERDSTDRVRELNETLDSALASREMALDGLRKLDLELAVSYRLSAAHARSAADLRNRILAQMERLEELGGEIRRYKDRELVDTENLDGYWLIEISGHGSGLLELRLDGTLVSGSYLLDNGAQGSVRGIYANHRIELDRIDTVGGFESTLEGTHNTVSGELKGHWQARDVSDGRSSYGDWSARKLAPGEIIDEP